MEGLNSQVIRNFGIKAKSVRKTKGFYIVNTADGQKIIRKSFDSAEAVVFQQEIKNCLIDNKFMNIDKYYLSVDGVPYYNYEGSLYVMVDNITGNEADFAGPGVFEKVVEIAALFHQKSKEADFSDEIYSAPDLVSIFENGKKEMEQIKRQINTLGRLSDFDVIFIKNYEFYYGNIVKAISILKDTNYLEKLAIARDKKCICHNQLKKENLILSDEEIYITNFSACKVDYFIWDLASLIGRYIKHKKTDLINIIEVIDVYSAHADFDEDDVAILYAVLLYPNSFLKAARQYYSKRRSWAPSSIINRMQLVIDNKDLFNNYIEAIKSSNI